MMDELAAIRVEIAELKQHISDLVTGLNQLVDAMLAIGNAESGDQTIDLPDFVPTERRKFSGPLTVIAQEGGMVSPAIDVGRDNLTSAIQEWTCAGRDDDWDYIKVPGTFVINVEWRLTS